MGDSSGWVPCQHPQETEITLIGDPERSFLCIECGQTRVAEESGQGHGVPAGWRLVETNVDTADNHVRVTITEHETGRIVYSSRYSPDTARTLARALTLNAYRLEDST